jgi:iron complex outermembrane receptor protein
MNRISGFNLVLRSSVSAFFIVAMTATALAQQADTAEGATDIVVKGQRQQYVGDVPTRDLPQNISSLSAETLKIVGITRLDDALDLVSGVSRQNNFGGLWDSFAVRGFAGDSNVPSGFLVNGFNAGRGFAGPRDASSVERIDVLKGPTSALFGRGEPGGTVNIVTKKPQFEESGYLTLQGGSFNTYRAEADFTTPLSDNFAVRLNGAYEDADSYRDTVKTKKIFITPSILWKLGPDSSVSYEMEFSHQEVPFDRGIPILNNDFGRLPASRYLGEPGDGPTKLDALGHQFQFQHDFSKKWGVLLGAGYRETDLIGIGEYPELVASRQPFLIAGPTNGVILSRQRRNQRIHSKDLILRGEINGEVDVAGIVNHLIIGADYDKFTLDQFQSRFRPQAYNSTLTLAQINGINVLNPVYGAYAPVNAGALLVYNKIERAESWGVYAQDQIDLTDWLKVRVGGRYDHFKQNIVSVGVKVPGQSVNAFSPQVGAVVQPIEQISLYASYAKGFRPNTGLDFFGSPFAPERTKAYEVGVKFATDDKKLTATVALFQMDKNNIITADPNPAHSGFVIAIGTARSKGVEADIDARLPYDFHLTIAYAYTDAYSTSTVLDPDFGKSIFPGDRLINIPKHSGSALLLKNFAIGGRKATLGAGVNYVGDRLGETGTTFTLPSYTLVRVLASVDITDKIRLAGNINNLLNKRWYSNSYSALWTYPGSPRSFSVRATYSF